MPWEAHSLAATFESAVVAPFAQRRDQPEAVAAELAARLLQPVVPADPVVGCKGGTVLDVQEHQILGAVGGEP